MLEQHQGPWSTKQQEELSMPAFSIEEYLHRVDGANTTELVVVLHGMGGSPRKMEKVFCAVRKAKPAADIFLPRLPYADWKGALCLQPPDVIVARLVEAIDRLWERRKGAGGRYKEIVLIGHSMGSVIVRKLAVVAHGEDPEAPLGDILAGFAGQQREWAPAVRRIVLLAGMSRGWSPSSALDWVTTVLFSIGSFIGDTVFNGNLTIFGIRTGAPFLIQTRLQWLALMRRAERPSITVVQLLGTKDDLVAPDDTVDFAVDIEDDQQSFVLIEVPRTGHFDIVDMAPPTGQGPDRPAAEARWEIFVKAIALPEPALITLGIRRDLMADSLPPKRNVTVSDVVFVIHGIRDKGFWTQKIARSIRREAEHTGSEFRSMTTSYGYFAMAPFVLPWVRRRKVAWLMDRYTEAKARYPKARFSYVGHSNGTYLVARALRDYPAAHFRRIVFAGSVVRHDYDWKKLIRGPRQRVESILNYVATNDWVVAIFTNGMQPFPAIDLGSAGHDGFRQLAPPQAMLQSGRPVVHSTNIDGADSYEVRYVHGGHGAGVQESQWDDIAAFVVNGTPPRPSDPDLRARQFSAVRPFSFSWLATSVLIIIMAVAVGLGWLIARSTSGAEEVISVGLYLFVLYLLVTRF